MDLTIPRTPGEPLTISIDVGQQLYIVGANGAGKSRPITALDHVDRRAAS